MSPHIGDLIRALARPDWSDAGNLLPPLRRLRPADGRPIAAAFTLAANQYFGPDPGPTEIADWVSDIRVRGGRYPLPALHMERLICAALGEPAPIDTIPTSSLLAGEILMLGHLLREPPMTPTELEEFITEAANLAIECP